MLPHKSSDLAVPRAAAESLLTQHLSADQAVVVEEIRAEDGAMCDACRQILITLNIALQPSILDRVDTKYTSGGG